MSDRCRDCTAAIRWERTWPGRKQIALDREPSPEGTVRIVGLDDADELQHATDTVTAGQILTAPIGTAVTLDWLQRGIARQLEWELHTVHASTCPNRQPSQ